MKTKQRLWVVEVWSGKAWRPMSWSATQGRASARNICAEERRLTKAFQRFRVVSYEPSR